MQKNIFGYKIFQPIINAINKLIDESGQNAEYTASNGITIKNNIITLNHANFDVGNNHLYIGFSNNSIDMKQNIVTFGTSQRFAFKIYDNLNNTFNTFNFNHTDFTKLRQILDNYTLQ